MAGYAPTDWTCTNGGGGAFDAGSVTLAPGDDPVTCSITNDDQPVELIIEKTVINDDGGSAVVDDFGITTSAGTLDLQRAVERQPDDRLHRRDPGGRARHLHPRRDRGGRLRADRLDLHQRRRRRLRRRLGHARLGDDPVTCSITNNDFSIEVLKAADDHLIPLQGQDVNFTYTVTNTSDVPVEIVVLEDDVFGPLDGDDDCQVGTVLPPGGSCEFVETFFVASDVAPNGDPDQEFPPHVNIVTGCSVPAADPGTVVVVAAAPAPASCDDDPETIEFDLSGAVLPDSGLPRLRLPPTDVWSGTPGSSSGDPRLPWLAELLTVLIALVAVGANVHRRRRSRDLS